MACPLCPKGSLPASYADVNYKPQGRDQKLVISQNERASEKHTHSISCYVSGDPKWKTAIIVCHDVFGKDMGKHKALCDALAAGGHYVICPDFFEGGSIEPYYKSKEVPAGLEWLRRFNWQHCSNILEHVYLHLEENGIKKVGAIGFCWGCWVVAKMTQDHAKCQAGVWAHPSVFVGKDLYEGETEHELAAAVKSPTLIMPSKQEPDFYRNGELVKIIQANGVAAENVDFSDMLHGWVTRGAGWLGTYYQGTTDVKATIGVQRAINISLGFYAKHFGQY